MQAYFGGLGLGRHSHNRTHHIWCGVAALLVVLARVYAPARADAETEIFFPRYELFSGVDVTSNSIFGYAGGVWAFGRSVSGESLRVKALTGTGGYDYDNSLPGIAGSVNFDGDVVLAQLFGSYLWRRGEWTVKAYSGLGFEGHDISPNDLVNSVNGGDFAIMGQLEL